MPSMYGPPVTFLGVPAADLSDMETWAGADIVIIGAPYDSGASNRPGARFGPNAIRGTDYLPHTGSRHHLSLAVDSLADLRVVDVGDVEMLPGQQKVALNALQEAVETVTSSGAIPVVLGGDHSITWPDVTGVARALGWGDVAVLHFDAHADTGEIIDSELYGHGTPMRRLIESGATPGDRFIQVGLRGYWPGPEVLAWMREQDMRSYEMSEIGQRGLNMCLTESFARLTDGCNHVFLSVDIDVVDPGAAPGTGTPEPGGLTSRELLDAVRRAGMELPLVGMDLVEVAPPYDHSDITAYLANRLILEVLGATAWRRRHQSGAPVRRPEQALLDSRLSDE